MAARPKHERYAISYADHLFKTFLDPGFHGARFTWEGFPDMVARLVASSVWSAYATAPADMEHKEQQAMEIAREHAQKLMDGHEGPLPTLAPA